MQQTGKRKKVKGKKKTIKSDFMLQVTVTNT